MTKNWGATWANWKLKLQKLRVMLTAVRLLVKNVNKYDMEYFEDLEVSIEFKWNIDRLPKVTVYNANL